MLKILALITIFQTTLVFSPVVHADDAKPATAAKADTKMSTKKDADCDCKECAGKKCSKKSCKTHKHCKMEHHSAKGKDAHSHDEGDVEGTTHDH